MSSDSFRTQACQLGSFKLKIRFSILGVARISTPTGHTVPIFSNDRLMA